jgi:alkyldihydroxyacetonephosphate synthase
VNDQIDHTLRDRWVSDTPPLPGHAVRWLRDTIGLTAGSAPAQAPAQASAPAHRAPESALPERAGAALAEIVGDANLLLDGPARLGRAGGLSYLDLLSRRTGEPPVPDAVVLPADPEQVGEVLRCCAEHDIGVVPFGGGTSVVGGVQALRGGKPAVVVLDLMRLDKLVSVDPVSRVAVLQAGATGPRAERLLAEHGLTLGHVPQSFERATIGGFAATRSAGQASSGYGHFADMVAAVRLATPSGELAEGVAPVSAAGPDLRQLVLGSEGAFGVITEVTLRVRPIPAERHYEGFVLDGWRRGTEAVRALAQHGVLADVTRLSDVDETAVSLALTGGLKSRALRGYLALRKVAEPCLLILGWESADKRERKRRRAAALRVLRAHRPVRLGTPLGEAWRHGRFNGPRQRDALLDIGVCVETLETSTYWSTLDRLREAVREALTGALSEPDHRPVIMCHVSHVYPTGASLYFTVLTPRSATDPVGQWQRAKAAASRAISDGHLGTISHHHATGLDHMPYLAGEIGGLGVDVLAAVKHTLDPTGIMNPGKLVSERQPSPRPRR